jgi:fluoroacetyl-CoA thioesterase
VARALTGLEHLDDLHGRAAARARRSGRSADEDSVGVELAVEHLAPALPGVTVEITVEVTAVEGRKVTFTVEAKDELGTISTGLHARFVAEKAKIVGDRLAVVT